ncbi:MAG: universal stress protein [Hyphomicrobiaceae bacterium]|nr:universal stress protein [Hyphomicrobiaceae bacterium]
MKTILVPVAGSAADAGVLSAANVLSRALGAHLDCLHIKVDPAAAALNTPHIGSTRGAAVAGAFRELRERSSRRLAAAAEHVKAFCAEHEIPLSGEIGSGRSVHWLEAAGDPLPLILAEARHHDLTIMARPAGSDGLPHDRLETILMASGRPLLVLPPGVRPESLARPVILWKETPEAARAVKAALPILAAAGRTTIIGVAEAGEGEPAALISYLALYGVEARFEPVERGRAGLFAALEAKARALHADVMIMGGYGRSRLAEFVFGGVTQTALERASLPVLVMH